MRWSRYAVLLGAGGDEQLAVSFLSRTVIKLDAEASAFVAHLRDAPRACGPLRGYTDLLALLLEGQFLVPDDVDEWQLVKGLHQESRRSTAVLQVTIAPTLGCNLRCHYCFQSHTPVDASTEVENLTFDHVSQALERYDSLHIQWFGGEPLANLAYILSLGQRLHDLACHVNKPYSSDIVTNGYFLDETTASSLRKLGVLEAQVTFEGGQNYHDKVRRTMDGGKTYQRLVNNVVAASAYLDINVRVHVAPYNLPHVHDLIEDLAAQGLAGRLKSIYFAPLFDYPADPTRSKFQIDEKKFLTANEFSHAQVGLVRHAMAAGFSCVDPLGGGYQICVAMLNGSLMIGPEGSVTKCYLDFEDEGAQLGSLKSTLDGNKAAVWSNYDFTEDKECAVCKVAPLCLGGCPKQRMLNADKSLICSPLRYNMLEMLTMRYGAAEPP